MRLSPLHRPLGGAQVYPLPEHAGLEDSRPPPDFGARSGALPKIVEGDDGGSPASSGSLPGVGSGQEQHAPFLSPATDNLGWGYLGSAGDNSSCTRPGSPGQPATLTGPDGKKKITPVAIGARRNSKPVFDLEVDTLSKPALDGPQVKSSASEAKSARRSSVAAFLEGGSLAASSLASGAGTVSSMVKSAGRRMSVALGFESARPAPAAKRKPRQRAIGNEVQAFLSMVPGGDGESITREQYATLFKKDLKRLKLGRMGDDAGLVDKVVSSVFGQAEHLDLAGFEHLLQELGMPVGRFMQEQKASRGRLLRVDTLSDGKKSISKRVKSSLRKIFDDNGYQLWTGVYIATNAILGAYVYMSRKGWLDGSDPKVVGAWNGELVNFARVFGMLLNLNGVLVLVPMCRAILTSLQGTPLVNYFPFEKAYDAHQVIGAVTFGFSVLHGLSHILNLVLWEGWSLQGSLWCGKEQDGFLLCSAVSGIILQVVFCVMIAFSMPYFRKSQRFNYFWAMHHLVIVFYIILLLHGRVFWKFLLPILGTYAFDRFLRHRSASFPAEVLLTKAKGDKVMQIRFAKPARLNYQAGQWVFLKSPAVTKYEWHPFTLTSSPEDPFLECHIKAVGDWTEALHEHYDSKQIVDGKPVFSLSSHTLQVDGPHGAPAQDWSQYQSAVLISAGIGVTPFASIIKHMHIRMQQCKALEQAGLQVPGSMALNLKKVYFIWICRSKESLEWFTELIAETKRQMGDTFEIHVYLSSVSALGDVTAGMTHLGLHAYYQRHKLDAITGLETLTNYDRPNWQDIFSKLADHHTEEKVGVFYCGPKSLGNMLSKHCKVATASSSTTFTFAKENF